MTTKRLFMLDLTLEEAELVEDAIAKGVSPEGGRSEYEVLQKVIVALDNQRGRYMGHPAITDAETAGLALARYFQWEWSVIDACIAALEDANFHDEAGYLYERRRTVQH